MVSMRGRDCFIMMPYGERNGINFDQVFGDLIQPAVEDERVGLNCRRQDLDPRSGFIHQTMVQNIIESPIVIADITTLNPNVLYELGVRHALAKKITIIIQNRSYDLTDFQQGSIPFDIASMQVMFYDMSDAEKIETSRQLLVRRIRGGIESQATDSLVHAIVPGLEIRRHYNPIQFVEKIYGDLKRINNKKIGIITGDVMGVENVDIWVNAENTRMEMARFHDSSVSAIIRFYGAKRDGNGFIVNDTIADALRKSMRDRPVVEAGTVIPTVSGALKNSNNVQSIFHAAVMHGQPGWGHSLIRNYTVGVTNVLRMADQLNTRRRFSRKYKSMMIPLFGTRSAGQYPQDVADRLFETAYAYLVQRPQSSIETLLFLAHNERDLDLCETALQRVKNIEKKKAALAKAKTGAGGPGRR